MSPDLGDTGGKDTGEELGKGNLAPTTVSGPGALIPGGRGGVAMWDQGGKSVG